MSSVKPLVYAVIRFLREQSQMDAYTSDEQESLEDHPNSSSLKTVADSVALYAESCQDSYCFFIIV
ncbi:Small glutamine-rich tetratricopeptide repeat-containing protein beta [Microtus ochrogaster]|uniref:Small glutamine-rich tetratricopeptide repeat-containing protein beta n=1 Tax=Microtus ochrogaster TaxID=79684 RepID=A0A8J6KXZ5_MICOH|nr:Small glutamine-rich tetratricopeptide repeat-containing protein beta [Microtus ochrogaster]